MPSTYTTNNGIEKIGTGEQSGTWGDTTNLNLDILDQALDGQFTVVASDTGSSGSPNTFAVTDGSVSDGRNRLLIFSDGGDLGGSVYYQLTPVDAEKFFYIRNSFSGSRDLVLFQGTYNSARDLIVPAGKDVIVKFSGTGSSSSVAAPVFADLSLDAATIASVDINGGTIDGVTIGTNAVATDIRVDNLQLDGNTLSSTDTNGNVVIAPNGDGDVQLDADTVRVGDNNADVTITTNGTGDLTLNTNGGTNSGSIEIQDGANTNIIVTANGTGKLELANGDVTTSASSGSDVAGQDLTIQSGASTGNAAGGDVIFQTSPAGAGSGTNLNSYATVLTLTDDSKLKIGTSTAVDSILDEDNMASDSATALSTQQSIKAYVDAQVGSFDTLAEVLAQGNTTGGTDIVVSVDDVISMDNGTNLLPSLTTTGDLNTGLYFPAADEVGLTVGGTQRLNVSAAGVDVTGTLGVTGVATFTSTPVFTDDIDVRDNIALTSDAARITFGADSDVILTHLPDNGIQLNTNMKMSFRDSNIYVHSSADGQLDLIADTEIQIAATTVDINGNLDVSGTALVTGVLTTTAATVFNGGFASNAASTIATTDNSVNLTLTSTDADASGGPKMNFYRNSSSPAAGDILTQINHQGENDAGETVSYMYQNWRAAAVGDGAESGQFDINTYSAGSAYERLGIDPTETVFNQDSADLDFRVEGNNHTHAIFLQASSDRVGINESSPDTILHISDSSAPTIRITNTDTTVSSGQTLSEIQFEGSDASTDADGIRAKVTALSGGIGGFTSLQFFTAGENTQTLTRGLDIHPTRATFNEDGGDVDFRVESDDNTHMLFVDASNDRVGVGESAPATFLDLGFTSTDQTQGMQIHNKQYGGYGAAIDFVSRTAASFGGGTDKTAARIRVAGANNWADAGNTASLLRFEAIGNNILQNLLELSPGGGAVFNQDSIDMDFRVESDANSHMLFVDAANNGVGIGDGTTLANGLRISSSTGTTNAVDTKLYINADSSGTTTTGFGPGITFAGVRNGDGTLQQMAKINVVAEVNSGTTLSSGFQFMTATAGVNTEKLRIQNDGAVIIKPNGITTGLRLQGRSSDNNFFVQWNNNDGTTNYGSIGSVSATPGLQYSTDDHKFVNQATNSSFAQMNSSGTVFNEDSQDRDFRVESANNGHMIFVDAGNDAVNIGTSGDFSSRLTISGAKTLSSGIPTNQLSVVDGTAMGAGNGGAITLWGKYTTAGSYAEGASIEAYKSNGTSTNYQYGMWLKTRTHGGSMTDRLFMDQAQTVFNETGADTDFRVESDTKTHGLFLDASTNILHLGGSTQATSTSFLNCGGVTFSNGSAPTGHFFSWDNEGAEAAQNLIAYYYDGAYKNRITIAGNTGATTINDSGDNVDFRVESDTNANMLFVDAGLNRVGIGTANPIEILSIEDSGNTPTVYVDGNSSPALWTGRANRTDAGQHITQFAGKWNDDLVARMVIAAGDDTTNKDDGRIVFYTAASGTMIERQRIEPNGDVIFNDTGVDADFRVESDINANAIFMNAETGTVSINTSASYGTSGSALTLRFVASSQEGLHIRGTNSAGTFNSIVFSDNNADTCGRLQVDASNNTVSLLNGSDYRLKQNVVYDWDATTRLKQLKPARFSYISNPSQTLDGFIAHELQTVVPEAASGTHNEVDSKGDAVMQGVDQSKIVPLLVKTIQELEARITALENA